MSSEQVIACLHANTRARRDYVSCDDCGSVCPDSGWGIARGHWFASLEDAMFYKQNGRLPDRLSTPANLVTVPASELRAMREEIERLRASDAEHRDVAIKAAINSQDMVQRLSALLDGIEAEEAELLQPRTLSQFMGPHDMALALIEERAKSADRLKALREKANG